MIEGQTINDGSLLRFIVRERSEKFPAESVGARTLWSRTVLMSIEFVDWQFLGLCRDKR